MKRQPKAKPARREGAPAAPPAQPRPTSVRTAAPLPPGDDLTPRQWVLYGAGLLVALFLAYSPVLNGAFLWDDDIYVWANPTLSAPGGLLNIWLHPTTASASPYPLIFTVYWFLYRLFGLSTPGYHVANILFHAGCAFMLAVNLRRLRVPGALLAGAAFALHPVEVDSVAMINELKDVMSGLFYMLAMWQWIKFVDEGRRRQWGLSLAFFLLAMLSKTITCTFPITALLIACWRRRDAWRRWTAHSLPYFVIAGALGFMTALWEKGMGAQGEVFSFSLLERLRIACRAPWFYMAKALWPSPLVFTYPRWILDAGHYKGWLCIAASAGLVAAIWAGRRRIPFGALLPVIYFVVTLGPALGFINFTSMEYTFATDHYQYLSGIGIIVFAVMLGTLLLERAGLARFRPVVAGGVLAALACVTATRAGVYVNAETLFKDNLRKHPDSWIAAHNVGVELGKRGAGDEAVHYYEEAIRVLPDYTKALNNLGYYYQGKKDYDKALYYYERAALSRLGTTEAWGNWGTTLLELGRVEEAAEKFEGACRIRPELRPSYCMIINDKGVDLMTASKYDEAIRYLEVATRFFPNDMQAPVNLRTARKWKADAERDKAKAAKQPTPPPTTP